MAGMTDPTSLARVHVNIMLDDGEAFDVDVNVVVPMSLGGQGAVAAADAASDLYGSLATPVKHSTNGGRH